MFFSLQILQQRVTKLIHLLEFLYPLVVGSLVFLILIGVMASVSMWKSSHETELRQNRRNWCITFLLMLAAAISTTACSAAYARGLPVGSFAQEFDQNLWAKRTASEFVPDDITIRQKMLGHVIETIVKSNSKQEIVNLLGPSENDMYFSETGRDLIYRTGMQRDSFLAIDSEWLLIWFDSDGRVTRYVVWSD